MKGSQLQKIVAGSRLTLPVTVLYGLVIWFISGVIQHQWWIQMACYVLATYLMILLNNFNALIRVYSRAITSAFIILSCLASFLFPSLEAPRQQSAGCFFQQKACCQQSEGCFPQQEGSSPQSEANSLRLFVWSYNLYCKIALHFIFAEIEGGKKRVK